MPGGWQPAPPCPSAVLVMFISALSRRWDFMVVTSLGLWRLPGFKSGSETVVT